jgi:protein TonB
MALALILLMASATRAVAVNDDSDATRPATQEFNFRIGGPDQRQRPVTAPQQAEILFRANRLPNTGPNIGVVCPRQVAPEFPRRAQMEGIESVVTAQIRVRNGVVQEVMIVEGHPFYDGTVKAAMMQYKCISTPDDVIVTQTFTFKLE